MLFLLNDVVFDLDEAPSNPSLNLPSDADMDLDGLIALGCDLYAQEPNLHHQDPDSARRLAHLLARHGEGINAAQFYAPEGWCDPLLVEPRFCVLPQVLLMELKARNKPSRQGTSTASLAEQMVWTIAA